MIAGWAHQGWCIGESSRFERCSLYSYLAKNIAVQNFSTENLAAQNVRASPPAALLFQIGLKVWQLCPKPPSPVGPIIAFWRAKRYERRQTEDNSFEIGVELISLASLDFTSLANQIHLSTHQMTHWTPVLASFKLFRWDASTWTSFGMLTITCHGCEGLSKLQLEWVLVLYYT